MAETTISYPERKIAAVMDLAERQKNFVDRQTALEIKNALTKEMCEVLQKIGDADDLRIHVLNADTMPNLLKLINSKLVEEDLNTIGLHKLLDPKWHKNEPRAYKLTDWGTKVYNALNNEHQKSNAQSELTLRD